MNFWEVAHELIARMGQRPNFATTIAMVEAMKRAFNAGKAEALLLNEVREKGT